MKTIRILLAAVLIFSLTSVSAAFAQAGDNTSTIDKKDYKILMSKVKDLVKSGQSDKASSLTEAVELRKKFKNANDEANFTHSLDANNDTLVKEKLKNVKVEGNEQKVIEFDDGSFIVLSSKTFKVSDKVSALTTSYSGQGWNTDAHYQIWGVYLAAEYHLVTDYNVYSTYSTVTFAATAGTYSVWPTTISSQTATITVNNQRTNTIQGNYVQVDGISIGGQPIGFTHAYALKTTITVNYASGGSIDFTASSQFYG